MAPGEGVDGHQGGRLTRGAPPAATMRDARLALAPRAAGALPGAVTMLLPSRGLARGALRLRWQAGAGRWTAITETHEARPPHPPPSPRSPAHSRSPLRAGTDVSTARAPNGASAHARGRRGGAGGPLLARSSWVTPDHTHTRFRGERRPCAARGARVVQTTRDAPYELLGTRENAGEGTRGAAQGSGGGGHTPRYVFVSQRIGVLVFIIIMISQHDDDPLKNLMENASPAATALSALKMPP